METNITIGIHNSSISNSNDYLHSLAAFHQLDAPHQAIGFTDWRLCLNSK
jgi:hypothetical protein